jgi:hypothetical protein
MRQYFFRVAILILIVLLAVLLGRPCLDALLFAATSPRPIAARSDLAETERATIGLFERVSPSVVQVVGVAASSGSVDVESEGGREQSGTVLSGTARAMWSPTTMWCAGPGRLPSASPPAK